MSDFGKNRVLALYKILTAYTDEQHQISMQDILVTWMQKVITVVKTVFCDI